MLTMRALIVDDHPLMREAVSSLLRELRPQVQLLLAGTLAQAQRLLEEQPALDAAVLDLQLPDGDCEALVRRLRQQCGPALRMFVLSASTQAADARRVLRAGANGYCPKGECHQTLASALRLVLEGGNYLPPLLLGNEGAQPGRATGLTARQEQVLTLLASGLSNKAIAGELDIAERTVKLHVQALFELLGANNRTHAVSRARQAGLLDAAPQLN